MSKTINEVMGVLNYIFTRDENEYYHKHLKKVYNSSIEYISNVDIIIIPKIIFILTDNIKEDYNNKVLNLYISLLKNIHSKYNKNTKICTMEYYPSNYIDHIDNKREITIIRGNTLTLTHDSDFEIWIYTDSPKDNINTTENINNQTDITNNMNSYRIIISNSNNIKKMLDDDLSVKIYIE